MMSLQSAKRHRSGQTNLQPDAPRGSNQAPVGGVLRQALERNKGLNLAVDASRLAALLVAQMRLAFSLLAPGDPGASTAILNPLFFSSA
jgi:hypothetical protein